MSWSAVIYGNHVENGNGIQGSQGKIAGFIGALVRDAMGLRPEVSAQQSAVYSSSIVVSTIKRECLNWMLDVRFSSGTVLVDSTSINA